MGIPSHNQTGAYFEQIGDHTCERRPIAGREITFIVEKTRQGTFHPCTAADVAQMLGHIPASDWAGIHTIVFRAPTRKQAILASVWGRLSYYSELANGVGRIMASGPMIFLEGSGETHFDWPSALSLEDQAELERLREDGHDIEWTGKRHLIRVSRRSARNTQLYRTLPHEIGHWFDWLEKVETPVARGEDFNALSDRYFARPSSEREAFAHRYADDTRKRLMGAGVIPFAVG